MGDLGYWDVMDSDRGIRMNVRLFHGANLRASNLD